MMIIVSKTFSGLSGSASAAAFSPSCSFILWNGYHRMMAWSLYDVMIIWPSYVGDMLTIWCWYYDKMIIYKDHTMRWSYEDHTMRWSYEDHMMIIWADDHIKIIWWSYEQMMNMKIIWWSYEQMIMCWCSPVLLPLPLCCLLLALVGTPLLQSWWS